ncbi:type II toxin-antitoxin system HicA family toxin [Microbacterium sp. CCH5-D1]|jgi:predicted RNA binding protein YcfA (HicA-like mRNA interferase family)|uniref:type II toxin-antitoxin system HicA family toxin n=1 Tax=Microbacterium sp. CCH5-D1 TaxID=1768780 RepID=UPI00076AE256|nr:type II toxin-antitoxin system HicA family toxin [Microbacterium sp. CCH5-D1]
MTSGLPTPRQIAARVAPRAVAAAAARSTPEGRRLSRKAGAQILELGIDVSDVDRAISSPHSTEPTHQHNGTLYIRGDLGVIVPDDDQALIVGLVRVDPDITPLRRARRAGGGPSRRMPTTTAELEQLLRGHGFQITAPRGGHRKALHPDRPGVLITIPHTPSDSRSYPNLVADIRRLTGIDITQSAP